MSVRLRLFVALIGILAVALLAAFLPVGLPGHAWHYAAWVVICILSESLWLPTLSGTGTVTMASTAGLAGMILWGQGAAVWIGAVSTLLAEVFVLRKAWVRATFNASQIAITTWMACEAFALLGGPIGGIENAGPLPSGESTALRLALPTLALFGVYLVMNRALVSVAVAWSTGRPYRRVLREDWFYPERLLEDAAAFLLSPLVVISFKAIGYAGVVLFYAPLRMLHESHRRYLELRNAQRMLIHSERMAAKGEMAAEIGHELSNILGAIGGRAQMISKEIEHGDLEKIGRYAHIILEQSSRMEVMSKGLMDFSYAELSIERVDLTALLQRTVELMRSQNRFDGIEWNLQLASPSPELRADPGQLQQVLINLFLNAQRAMAETGGKLRVVTRPAADDQVEIVVSDTGPGIAESDLPHIFTPFFSRSGGTGLGLALAAQIVKAHRGTIDVASEAGKGATFTIRIPAAVTHD